MYYHYKVTKTAIIVLLFANYICATALTEREPESGTSQTQCRFKTSICTSVWQIHLYCKD